MVSFINRKEVLKYQPLASYLAMLQADMIDDELDFAESEQAKQEIRKRYDAINYHQPGNVPTIEERIFYHPEEALLTYPPVIGTALQNVLSYEEVDKFYMLPHVKGSIITRLNDGYPPLRKARQTLKQQSNEGYDEAYEVSLESTKEAIQSLFWISRCDASVPHIVIQPAERSYFMHLCKYGNLHFYASPESKDAIPLKALRAAGFREWNGQEFERFDDSGTIAERVTRV